jgi:hypothetical protein
MPWRRMGSGGIAPSLLTSALLLSGRLHTPAALPPGKETPYQLDRRLDVPQSRSGRCGVKKNSILLIIKHTIHVVILQVQVHITYWINGTLRRGCCAPNFVGLNCVASEQFDVAHVPRTLVPCSQVCVVTSAAKKVKYLALKAMWSTYLTM